MGGDKMAKKKSTWYIFETNALKLTPDLERAKKDRKSGNNIRHHPKGHRKSS
jgi:hypothetical protein